MSTVTIAAGTTEPIHVYVKKASDGTALTGSTNLRIEIRRAADGYFLDFNDATFKASGWTTKRGTLTEVSSTDAPGWYRYSTGIDTTGWSSGGYFVTFVEITSTLSYGAPNFAIGEIRIVTATAAELSARIPASLASGRMDSSVGAVAAGALTAAGFAASAITSTVLADNAITSAKIATDAIGAAQIAADAIGSSELAATAANEIADALLDRALSGHTTSGTAGEALSRADVAVSTRLATASYTAPPSAATVADAVLDEIVADHATAGSAGVALSRLDVASSSLATAANLATAAASAASAASDAGLAASRAADLQSRTPATLSSGLMRAAVEAMATDTITAGAVATSAVTELQTGLATAASLATAAASAAAAAASAADLQARTPTALVGGRMDSSAGAVAADAISAAAVSAAAVTKIQNGLATAASLTSVGAAVAALPTAATIADAVLDEPLVEHLTAGTAGPALTRIDVTLSTRAATGTAMALTSGERSTLAAVTEAVFALAHGSGAWTTATGFAAAGDAMTLTSGERVAIASQVNTTLGGAHGAGAWATATGFAVAGDAMALTGGERTTLSAAIDSLLTTSHGAGAWAAGATAAEIATAVWAKAVGSPASGTFGRYVQRIFQLGFNRLELASTGGGQNVLYGDDASTPMVTFAVRDVAGGSLSLTTGSPSRRGAGVEA